MNLKKYDNKKVKIVTIDDLIFEGIASYNNKEFNESEYGTNEESIDLLNYKLYKSTIKKIEEVDNFTDKYGYLEESLILEDFDLLEDYLYEEDEEIAKRLISCLKDNIDKVDKDKANKILKEYKEN